MVTLRLIGGGDYYLGKSGLRTAEFDTVWVSAYPVLSLIVFFFYSVHNQQVLGEALLGPVHATAVLLRQLVLFVDCVLLVALRVTRPRLKGEATGGR